MIWAAFPAVAVLVAVRARPSNKQNIMKLLMFLPFHLVLKPLIRRNYRQRAAKLLPDEWYWADRIAVNYGYFVHLTSKTL